MYQIFKETISDHNGLGDFANVMQALTPVIQAGTSIAQTAINARNNQNPATPTPYTPYTGGSTYTPVVYQPTTTPPATTTGGENKKDWTPWLIGGAIAVVGIYLITRK